MATKKEVLEKLLADLEQGDARLILGADDERLPTIHNFYPRKYYESIVHCGFGFFEGKTEKGAFSFDGGGAMHDAHFEDKTWIAWSPLRARPEVLKDLGYDFEKVKSVLREIIARL